MDTALVHFHPPLLTVPTDKLFLSYVFVYTRYYVRMSPLPELLALWDSQLAQLYRPTTALLSLLTLLHTSLPVPHPDGLTAANLLLQL